MSKNTFDSDFDFDNDPVFSRFRSKKPEPKQDADYYEDDYEETESQYTPQEPVIDNSDLDNSPDTFDFDAFLRDDDYLNRPQSPADTDGADDLERFLSQEIDDRPLEVGGLEDDAPEEAEDNRTETAYDPYDYGEDDEEETEPEYEEPSEAEETETEPDYNVTLDPGFTLEEPSDDDLYEESQPEEPAEVFEDGNMEEEEAAEEVPKKPGFFAGLFSSLTKKKEKPRRVRKEMHLEEIPEMQEAAEPEAAEEEPMEEPIDEQILPQEDTVDVLPEEPEAPVYDTEEEPAEALPEAEEAEVLPEAEEAEVLPAEETELQEEPEQPAVEEIDFIAPPHRDTYEEPQRRRARREEPEEEYEEEEAPKKGRKLKVPNVKVPKISVPKVNLPKINLPKLKKPAFIDKMLVLYFGPLLDKEMKKAILIDPKTGALRKRMRSKVNQFKEIYLPPILLCLAMLMILSFVLGSVTNAFKRKALNDQNAKIQAQQASLAAEAAKAAFDESMESVQTLTDRYDFDNAISLLDQLLARYPEYQSEIVAKKSEMMNLKATMVQWDDLSTIPNLSFHVLIAEPSRAFADRELGGQYNRNFVTVGEFQKILEELYANNYILVDFNSLVTVNSGADGKSSYFPANLYLPQGKKPIMLTETMVNYFEYMVDSNGDHEADAGGDGFACKLVIDGEDNIKAMLIDSNSQTQIGDYDFVPVLETFIAQHPDFSYRGARATLAVTGSQGIFGYRTNTSYIASKGQAYYDQEVADAKQVVKALKEKGYTLACFTYANSNYRTMTVQQITSEMQSWTSQITPVLGDTDVLVYAKEADLDDYTGNKFTALYNSGFRFYVTSGETPKLEIKETYIRMVRLMVTGNTMGWQSSRFASYFDSNKVLDMTARGNIPN